jgi:hypothetical protein
LPIWRIGKSWPDSEYYRLNNVDNEGTIVIVAPPLCKSTPAWVATSKPIWWRKVNPDTAMLQASSRSGAGMAKWHEWLRAQASGARADGAII